MPSAAIFLRSPSARDRQDFQSKRKNRWSRKDPSIVSGTGGKLDNGSTSNVHSNTTHRSKPPAPPAVGPTASGSENEWYRFPTLGTETRTCQGWGTQPNSALQRRAREHSSAPKGSTRFWTCLQGTPRPCFLRI